MNRYLIICLILLFINIVSYGQENSSFIECNDCKRNGYLVDVSAYDPVNIYGVHTGNDGKLTSNGERALFDTYLHMLAEHSSNCFRLQAITSETLDEWQKENSDLQGIGSKW
jgi:hypothetical protein